MSRASRDEQKGEASRRGAEQQRDTGRRPPHVLNDERSACACQRAPLTDAQGAFTDEGWLLTDARSAMIDERRPMTEDRRPFTDPRRARIEAPPATPLAAKLSTR